MPRPALAFAALVLAGCGPHDRPPPSAEPPGGATRPGCVLIVRHAEKPADAADPGLSPRGRGRADALPALFRRTAGRPDPFPTPDFVFAAKASRHSDRPAATVAPLAGALGLGVDAGFASEDYRRLAAAVLADPRYGGQTVLICWHHGTAPGLAAALGARGVPGRWRDEAFDRVWVVTYDERGRGRPLADRPQALLPGDSEE